MGAPADANELELVRKAIELGRNARGYCEWNENAARRVRDQPPCQGTTPEGIKRLLIEYVCQDRGEIIQVKEKRSEYGDRRFYYKAIVPVPELRRGLFVELILIDDDQDNPSVGIVNAHEQLH